MELALQREPRAHARAPTLTRDRLLMMELRCDARERLKVKHPTLQPSLAMIGLALGLEDLNRYNGSTPWGRFAELKAVPSGVEQMESQVVATDLRGPLRTLFRQGDTVYLQDTDPTSDPYQRRHAWYLVPRDVLLERL